MGSKPLRAFPLGLTAVIEREGAVYVSRCPELDMASRGKTVAEAEANLVRALELYFEKTPAAEVRRRLGGGAGRISAGD